MTNLSLIQFQPFAMLFSAGMGIGLVFYGAAEPMAHFATPPTADPKTTEAYTEALRSTFFHWGFNAWLFMVLLR
ncbi:BCCT family transporter [Staphylococcus aureus]